MVGQRLLRREQTQKHELRLRRRAGWLLPTAVAVQGAASAVLVGREGSPGWQLIRVGIVVTMVVATAYALSRATERLRAAIVYPVGLVGTAVGVGIGAGHLASADAGVVMVAGVLSLVAGVLLLGVGSANLVRSARRFWRPPAAVVVCLVAFLVVYPTWPALYATNVPRTVVGSATPASHGLEYRDVRFTTPDGVMLSGWYLPSRTGAAVVLLHGAGSTRSAVLGHAVVLARHGYGVLLFDARGHGRSGGRAMDFGWYGDADIAGAVSYLEDRPDVEGLRIGAVGLSMGGEEVIGAAATDRRIRAVVAEGATGRTAADLEWLSDTYGVRGSLTEAWKALLTFGVTDVLTSAHPPVSLRAAVAQAAPRPVLLVAAVDVEAEPAAARYIRSAALRTVQVWQVPGCGHTRGLATHPHEWEARVLGFLDNALGGDG